MFSYLAVAWRQVFTETDVAAALQFMRSTWVQLVREFPQAVPPVNCKAPESTQTFGEHLSIKGYVSALSGLFDHEVPKSGTLTP